MTKEDAINILIKDAEVDTNKVSDGYHTFEELYEHRIRLFIALCRQLDEAFLGKVWRSLLHADGSYLPGWFILGIGTAKGEQITYHLPERFWDSTAFAEPLDRAPEWDGHTPADVLKRLEEL